MQLRDLVKYSKEVARLQKALNSIEPFDLSTVGDKGLLNIDDITKAEAYEDRVEMAKEALRVAKETYDKQATRFIVDLPLIISDLIRYQKFVLHAQWVTQDSFRTKYGPYAAYIDNKELIVEEFKNFEELEFAFHNR